VKYVKKAGAPHDYRKWCRSVKATSKSDYREMPSSIKALIHAALVNEQGEICAYTMRRIDTKTSHIEHIKPQSLCRNEGDGGDLDYLNMVACFPRKGMISTCRYGAHKKGDWWVPELFVSPLHRSCESHFRFMPDGKISSASGDEAAMSTVQVLGLNDAVLIEDRARAIREFIYGPSGSEPLRMREASRLRSQVCARSGGRFTEFCIALRDALDDHIKFVDRLARKKAFVRKKGR